MHRRRRRRRPAPVGRAGRGARVAARRHRRRAAAGRSRRSRTRRPPRASRSAPGRASSPTPTGSRSSTGATSPSKTVFAGTWNTTLRRHRAARDRHAQAQLGAAVGRSTALPAAQVGEHTVAVSDKARRVTLVERTERPASGRPDLGSASVVVAGGRGTEGDFSRGRGARRRARRAPSVPRVSPPTRAGSGTTRRSARRASPSRRGSTSASACPVRCTTAAACRRPARSSPINSDPDAPIFEIADFGVVGDLFTVVPQAAAEIRRLKG